MSNSEQILVLVVDHNPILLDGIALLIRAQPDMELVGTATSADVGTALYLKNRPDFTLIDLDLPGSAGVDAIRRIKTINPAARMIGLATYELDNSGMEALTAGATAILAKDQIAETLVKLIRTSFGR